MAFRFGTRLADMLSGTGENDLFIARGGDDEIETGGGIDVVLAGTGADIITIGSGTSIRFAGWGEDADVFRFTEGAAGVTTIVGFQDGIDKIDLSGLGISGLSELVIATQDRASVIVTDGMSIAVTGNSAPLDADDFIFAPRDPRTLDFDINQAAIRIEFGFPPKDVRSDAPVIEITSLMGWDKFNFVEVNERGAPFFTASGDNAAVNLGGAEASFSALDPTFINDAIDDIIDLLPEEFPDGIDLNLDTDFDFLSFRAGGLSEALTLTVTGFDDGAETGAQVFELGAGEMGEDPFLLDPTIFSSVDKVVFSAAAEAEGDTRFLIDDIIVADDLVEIFDLIPSLPDAVVALLV